MYKISIYVKIKFTFKHISTIEVPNFHGDIPFYPGLKETKNLISNISYKMNVPEVN